MNLSECKKRAGKTALSKKENKRQHDLKFRRSKKGVIRSIYGKQIVNSKKRGHKSPTYSEEKLTEILMNCWDFEFLYKRWKQSHYKMALKPAIGRIDHSKGYTIKNIELTTVRSNTLRHNRSKSELIKEIVALQEKSERLKGIFCETFQLF